MSDTGPVGTLIDERDALKNALAQEKAARETNSGIAMREVAELERERDALAVRVKALTEALDPFVRQVEEFECGHWDETDWPVAKDALSKMAIDGRRALSPREPMKSEKREEAQGKGIGIDGETCCDHSAIYKCGCTCHRAPAAPTAPLGKEAPERWQCGCYTRIGHDEYCAKDLEAFDAPADTSKGETE